MQSIMIATEKGPRPAEGLVAWFRVGNKRIRFFLHREVELDGAQISILSHYDSGYRVGSFAALRVSQFAANGALLTPREAAQRLLSRAIAINGPEKVLAVMAAAPVIN